MRKKKESLTNKTLNGFIWSGAGSGINGLIQVIILAVLARLINVESFGIVQAAMILVGFANYISQMGVGPALVQRKDLTGNHIRVGFTISIALGLFLGGALFLLSNTFASFFQITELSKVLKVISLLFIFESFVVISSSLMQRDMRFKEIALIEIISYFFGYGFAGIVFGYMGYDYWALVIAIFAQVIIKIICYFILQKHSLRLLWKKQEFKELIHYGGGHTLARVANYFANQGDNLVVGKYMGAQALGFYGRAYTLMVKPYSLITDALDRALFPAMSTVQDDKERLLVNFKKITQLLGMICIPLSFVFLVLGEPIVMLLLGKNWVEVTAPLQILGLTIVLRINSRVSDVLVRAVGDVYSRAWRKLIFAIITIVSCIIGQKWGLEGVSYGVVFANLINFALMATLTFKIININWWEYIKLYNKSLPLAIIFGTFLYGWKVVFKYITSIDILILTGSLVLSVTFTILVLLKYKSFFLKDVKEHITLLLKKFRLGSLIKFL
ncbi:MAG TPA: lipopolysaccharide biosynthesis protein [Niabella sp.]|nr:lipopolysaccharide biosynthesis protein [Agriterribacter sp.]HUN01335.1 lipopolysaccharide biosynthesis protein [Niabella sp.]